MCGNRERKWTDDGFDGDDDDELMQMQMKKMEKRACECEWKSR